MAWVSVLTRLPPKPSDQAPELGLRQNKTNMHTSANGYSKLSRLSQTCMHTMNHDHDYNHDYENDHNNNDNHDGDDGTEQIHV